LPPPGVSVTRRLPFHNFMIELIHLVKRFGDLVAVNDISLEVPRGFVIEREMLNQADSAPHGCPTQERRPISFMTPDSIQSRDRAPEGLASHCSEASPSRAKRPRSSGHSTYLTRLQELQRAVSRLPQMAGAFFGPPNRPASRIPSGPNWRDTSEDSRPPRGLR